jgi:hypothetical protein
MPRLLETGGLLRWAGRTLSLIRRLASSVFDGMAGAFSLRIPAGSTYSGPLVRVRRSSDNAEQNFWAALTPDANGNRWLDEPAVQAFVRPTAVLAGYAQLTDTNFTTGGVASLSGTMFGGNVDAPRAFTVTNAVYPITSNQSYWYGAVDGAYAKAVLLQFTFMGGTLGIKILEARWQHSSQIANIAQAGTWNLSSPATSAAAAGYGARDVAFVSITGNGFVTTWYDQTSNASHASHPTAANQPRIVTDGVMEKENGRPAVYFGPAHWLYTGASSALATAPVAVVQAVRWITLAGGYRFSAGIGQVIAARAGLDIGVGGSGSNLYVGSNGVAGNSGTTLPTNAVAIVTGAHSGTDSSGYINRALSAGSALSFTYNSAGGVMSLGASRGSLWTPSTGDMRIQETTFFANPPAENRMERIERSQAAAFGITIS